jgi:peptidoglycan/LPS O-acetylase OafA/YrhL
MILTGVPVKPPIRPSRNHALDGLRGLAAIAVLLGHVVVATSVVQASQYLGDPQPLTAGAWLFAETPLVGVWAGQEWVVVFFVLSGFVLSLAAAGGARFDAARYYPARLVRLYVPVWAALIFAAVVHEAIAHDRIAGASAWLNLHATDWSATTTAHEIVLLAQAGDPYYTTVLWSLRWEVAFSLLLPVFLLCASRFPLRLLAALALAAIIAGGPGSGVLRYMPVFMLGTALAFGREQVAAALVKRRVYAPALVASPILLTATHWMPGGLWQHAAYGLGAVGASGLVATAMVPGPFAAWLQTRPMQFVGRRSFSLYLVHEPIVVAAAFALGGMPSAPVLLACAALPVAAATIAFYRCVELPAQTLARGAGRRSAELAHAGDDHGVAPHARAASEGAAT